MRPVLLPILALAGTLSSLPAAATVTLPATATVNEGDALTLTVTSDITAPAGGIVVVLRTTAGTAGAADVVTGDVTVTILEGATTGDATIATSDDALDEDDETFSVDLVTVDGAAAVGSTAVTLVDDDAPPDLDLTVVNGSVAEGDGPAEALLTLSTPSGRDIPVTLATVDIDAVAGVDFSAPPAVVVIPAGATSAPVSVDLLDNALDEDDRQFSLVIVSAPLATVGADTATFTILDDDDAPTLTLSGTPTVDEDAGPATLTLTLSAPSGRTVSGQVVRSAGTAGAADVGPAVSFSLAPGDTVTTVAIAIVDDALDEDSESATFATANVQNATGAGTGTITIADDDAPPILSLAADATVNEGDAGTIAVSLSAPSGRDVTVNVVVSADTATAGDDFDADTIAVVIPAGQVNGITSVATVADVVDEDDETFDLALENAGNATIGANDTATITILDDDDAPGLSIADVSVAEGAATGTVTVTLSATSGKSVRFSVRSSDATANEPGDYRTINEGNVVIAPGQRNATVPFDVEQDALDEDDETFTVALGTTRLENAVLADGTATVTILDDDAPPVISVDDVGTVNEGNAANFTVRLSAPSGRTVTATASTIADTATAGADFVAAAAVPVTFSAGQTSRTVTIATVEDALDEEDLEDFRLRLASVDNASAGDVEAVARIADDDDPPTVSIDDASLLEGDSGVTAMVFSLRLSAPSGRATSVDAATADGSARNGRDYTSRASTVAFAAGATAATFAVDVSGDLVHEATTETFTVVLSGRVNLGAGDSTATGTITDNDPRPNLSIADATLAAEGQTPTSLSFVVSLSNPSEADVRADFVAGPSSPASATPNVDFFAQSGVVVVSALATTATVTVPIFGDAVNEADETFAVTLSNAQNGGLARAVAVGTIVDDDSAPRLVLGDVTVDETAANASLTLLLSEPSGLPAAVDFATVAGTATAGADFLSTSGRAVIAAGQQSTTILVPLLDDALDELDEGFRVVLSNPADAELVDTDGAVTIRDNDLAPRLDLAGATILEGDAGDTPLSFTATLSAPSGRVVTASATTAFVAGGADAADLVEATLPLRFEPGETSKNVVVTVRADRRDEADEAFRLQLEAVDGAAAGAPATGTILDDDSAPDVVADVFSTDEEQPLDVAAAAGLLGNDDDDDGDVLSVTVVALPPAAAGTLSLDADGAFRFTPALDFAGEVVIDVEVSDGANAVPGTLTLQVRNVNDAPVVDPAVVESVRVDEDIFDGEGGLVSEIVADAVSDVDLGALAGIALIGADDVAGGAFEVSFDGGAVWGPLPALGEATALLLAGDDTRLRLVPPPDENPAVSLRYVAWDQTDGRSEGDVVDVSAGRGGASAFSAVVGSIRFEVLPVNDAPVFIAPTPVGPLAIVEGQTLTIPIVVADDDGPTLERRLEDSTLPASATFDAATGVLSFTPRFFEAGRYTVTLVADDSLLQARRTLDIVATFIDDDADLVPDTVEADIGTNAGSADSDGDTIADRDELGPDPTAPVDTDNDGVIDALDDDSDGDGIDDAIEAGDAVLATPVPDSDGDGIIDTLDDDSDDDGRLDGADNCRTVDNADQADADGDLIGDACDDDADGDRLLDRLEAALGLDATAPDSDNDFILDGEEAPQGVGRDSDDDGTIDALDDDSDGDGLLDRDEAGDGELLTAPRDTDSDGDADFIDTDSDDDGVADDDDNCVLTENPAQEDLDGDGVGDLCLQVCGDGAVQFGEDCDDPDDELCGADCTRICVAEVCDGRDNDCDGDVDLVTDGNLGRRSVCLEDIEVEGGGVLGLLGCAQTTSSDALLWALLGLPLLWRRRRLPATGLVVTLLALTSGVAHAQLGVSGFTPAPLGQADFVVVEGTGVTGHLQPTAAVMADYGYGQLQVKDARTGAAVALLEHRLRADVVVGLSLWHRVALWAGLPVALYQQAGVDDVFQPLALAPFAPGDVRLGARWSILEMRRGPGVALSLQASLPSGDTAALMGQGSVTAQPQLQAGWRFGDDGRVAVNVGYLVRSPQQLLNLRVGNELRWGVAGEMALVPQALPGLKGLVEVHGAVAADPAITPSLSTSPAEVSGALRYVIAGDHAVTAGTAVGLTPGYGTPLARAFVGYSWTPTSPDRDRDGVPDDADRCPEQAEDEDFYEDGDGCPEEDPSDDADGDGVVDIADPGQPIDQCPELPEDKDGFEDDDGCPDTDHDGDGVPEEQDRCSSAPEDRDGFEDDDGCPDADNDKDGFADASDRCPDAAEVRNGFEDDDGCPDSPPQAVAAAPTTTAPTTTAPTTPTPTPTATTTAPTTPTPPAATTTAATTATTTATTTKAPRIVLPQKIYFAVGGAELTPESRRLVDQVAEALRQHPGMRVEIQGHTDGQGDDALNDHLALRRAESVVAFLVSRGIEKPRLLIAILGSSQPLAPNDSPRERALNRRVEFRVLLDEGP